MPTPAAVSEQTMTLTSGSLTKPSIAAWRAVRGLVAADRRGADAAPGEDLLGGVHDVEVLGEEDDLAGAAGQLDGVVGGELGLGLADLAHHGEDVVAGLGLAALGDLALGHPAYELVVDAVEAEVGRAGATVLERRLVATDQTLRELLLRLADGAADGALELDRQVGDTAGGDVGGDVDLAAADDAEVDHGLSRGRVERVVGRREAGLLERRHQRVARLALLDPAEHLPDRPEVLDVVDQRGAGQRHQQRPRDALADPLRRPRGRSASAGTSCS